MDDVFCIPLKEKKKGKWHVNTTSLIGKGQFGTVYGACKHSVCKYVMKVIPLTQKSPVSVFNKEVEIQNELASHGLSIPVEDSWKCKEPHKIGIIIMKVLDLTVRSFFLQSGVTEQDIDAVINGVHTLMNKLHSLGFYHGDNHFGNIMMKRIAEEEPGIDTSFGKYRLYLIDMGKAGRLSDPGVAAYGRSTASKRLRDDDVITTGEIKQTYARLRPSDIESIFI